MPTYVTLAQFTQQRIDELPNRSGLVDGVKDTAGTYDGEVLDVHITLGEYDMVVVSEFPDDESYARFALHVAHVGGVETETLKSLPEGEYADIVDDIPDFVPGGPAGEF